MFVAIRYIGSLVQSIANDLVCIREAESILSSPQAASPPAVEVTEEGEVTGEHVSGILGNDVLVDVARGVHIVVGCVAEGFDMTSLPEELKILLSTTTTKFWKGNSIHSTYQLEIFLFSEPFFSSNTFFLCSGFE